MMPSSGDLASGVERVFMDCNTNSQVGGESRHLFDHPMTPSDAEIRRSSCEWIQEPDQRRSEYYGELRGLVLEEKCVRSRRSSEG